MVDGKEVRRPNFKVSGRLASCDGLDEYMEIGNQLMGNIQQYAYHLAGGEEAKLDPAKFLCDVQSLPQA